VSQDFFQSYLEYTSGGEVPVCFHRWAALVGIGTILERNVHTRFGEGYIYPNMYTMLIGSAGTKKSTAIRRIKKLLIRAGYTHIAAERTSKEKYLADLSGQNDGISGEQDLLDKNIFGTMDDSTVTPNLIAADEANDFFGIGNLEFLSVLGSLWDWEGKYENRIKTGKVTSLVILLLASSLVTLLLVLLQLFHPVFSDKVSLVVFCWSILNLLVSGLLYRGLRRLKKLNISFDSYL
jgi:hypothetical protein